MRIMESRVKSIIREEVGRAIRSRLLREADDDYYGDDDPFGDDAAIKAGAEYGPEGYPDYDPGGEADGKDSGGEGDAPAKKLVVDRWIQAFFDSMNPKPVGLIVDCSNMESGPGGPYPLYQATEAGILTMISSNIGVAAFAFSDMISESKKGEMPEGLWIAGMIDTAESGPPTFQIYNTITEDF